MGQFNYVFLSRMEFSYRYSPVTLTFVLFPHGAQINMGIVKIKHFINNCWRIIFSYMDSSES